jgi:hypothetical protein
VSPARPEKGGFGIGSDPESRSVRVEVSEIDSRSAQTAVSKAKIKAVSGVRAFRNLVLRYFQPDLSSTFTTIFERRIWQTNESVSGPGSEREQTRTLVRKLPTLFRDFNISSVLDVPCGDFHWMQHVDLGSTTYTGGDIVEEIIERNRTYERQGIQFRRMDLTRDSLPKADLILCRDCLVHLSYKHISSALANIRASHSKFLLTTTYPSSSANFDIRSGSWRPLNLERSPFNFPRPQRLIEEECTEGDGAFREKSMGLWLIS